MTDERIPPAHRATDPTARPYGAQDFRYVFVDAGGW